MIDTQHWQTIWINVNIVTMADGPLSYGEILDGALAISDGKIAWVGSANELAAVNLSAFDVIDGEGHWLTPGLIDCHTHLVFGGNRANEFEMRLQGKSYQEIAQAGGGIVSTVKATRESSFDELLESAKERLSVLYREGVTTVEIKSGYGLDTINEIKMLEVANALKKYFPINIQRTFLGAHALPIEFNGRADDYIDLVCNEMIPQIAKLELADAVDVFCEGIGFNLSQTEKVFKAAKQHHLKIKVHAEQLSNLGASSLAATYGAMSSDHVEFIDEISVKAMSKQKMVAVLLPGAFYFLRETKLPPIELFREHQVAMAIATDCNPGSSPINSLQLMLNMACTLFRLTPIEALAGVTCNAAHALGLSSSKGKLAKGYDADIACWSITQPAQLCYQFGVNPLKRLMINGKLVS